MWTIASSLLLTCCCLPAALALTQDQDNGHGRSVWENIIDFVTKGTKDECSFSVAGQGDLTKLRITCEGLERSYWCEYQGKPELCLNYNKDSLHYYRQIMWDLRKLSNACQGQRIIKPLMCKRASDEARMVFTTSSSSNAMPKDRPAPARNVQVQPQPEQRPKPTRPRVLKSRPAQGKNNRPFKQRRISTPKPTEPQPTTQVPASEAKRLAKDYCWNSLQPACAFVIGWFKN